MKITTGFIVIFLGLCCTLQGMAGTDATAILNAQKDYFTQFRNIEFKSTQTIFLNPVMEMRIFNRTGRHPELPLTIPQIFRLEGNRFYFFEQIPPQYPYNTNAAFYDGTTYTLFSADNRVVLHNTALAASADPIGTDNPFLLLFAWAKRRPTEFSFRSLQDESYWDGPFDVVSVRDSETSPGLTVLGINLPDEGRRLYAEATFDRALQYYPTAVKIYDLSSDPSTSSVLEEVKLLEVAQVDTGSQLVPFPVTISYHKSLGANPQKNRYDLYEMKINQPLSSAQFEPATLPNGYIETGPGSVAYRPATPGPSFEQERIEWMVKAQKADAEFFNKQHAAANSRSETSTSAAQTTGTAAHELLEKALSQAEAEYKKVFLLCVTSHSGWCKLFDKFHALPAVKAILDKYYVVTRIEIDKLSDGREVFSAFGDATPPAWVIMDSQKTVISTSICRNIGNVGYPSLSHEIAHYTKALQASSTITQNELEVLTAGLKKVTPYYEPDKVRAASQLVCNDDFSTSTIAEDLVTSALSTARAESKNVFLISGFLECSWCKLFDKYHEVPNVERILKKYYVIEKLDMKNMPDGEAVFKKYLEPESAPAWVILDPSGKVLITSEDGQKGNVGYPAEPDGMAHYVKALKLTSPISEDEIKVLTEYLQKTVARKQAPTEFHP